MRGSNATRTSAFSESYDDICRIVGIPARTNDVWINSKYIIQPDDSGSQGTYEEQFYIDDSEEPFLTAKGTIFLGNNGGYTGMRFYTADGTEFVLSLEGNDANCNLVKEIRSGTAEITGNDITWRLLETSTGMQIIHITLYYDENGASEDNYYLCLDDVLVLIFSESSL